MTPETRPFSDPAWAMMHRIADTLIRRVGYFRDPANLNYPRCQDGRDAQERS